MKKSLSLFLFLFLLSVSIFAGGTSEKKIKTVTIWHPNTGKIGTAFEEIIEAFNNGIGKENGVRINAIYQGKANDVLTKVKASENQNLPDIAQMDATSALDMNASPFIVTADELSLDTSAILSQAKNAFVSERGLIALPFNASALLFYYNKTLFDSLGLNAPKTLDEFASIAGKLVEKDSKGNITRYAFSGVPTTLEITTFIGSQNGLSYIVNEKNGHMGIPSEVLMGKDGTYKEFLEKWKTLYSTGAISSNTSDILVEFASGRTASYLASSSNLSTIMASVGSSFELGVAEVPLVNKKATGGVALSGGALFSFSSAPEVKLVLEYLISDEVQLKWATATGYIPINRNIPQSPEWLSFSRENPLYQVALDEILESNPALTNVWLPSAYQIYYSFQENIDSVAKGKLSIDEGVSQMVNIIEGALTSYAEQNIN